VQFSRLQKWEFLGFLGAAVLALSLFLKWFATSGNGRINGLRGELTAFETFGVLDYLLLAACIAPFVLAFLIIRQAELSWRPGEVTMIVGMIAFVLIVCNGVILGKPGEPDSEIAFRIGYPVALVGALLITAGGLIRQAQGARNRKPPGTL